MSDKQDKHSLLVDQDEALSFYLDSLLSPDENDWSPEDESELSETSQAASESVADSIVHEQESVPETKPEESEAQRLQSAKDFLLASRERQKQKQIPTEALDSEAISQHDMGQTTEQKVAETQSSIPESEPKVASVAVETEQLKPESGIEPAETDTPKPSPASTSLLVESAPEKTKVITPGPLSPKPRERYEDEVVKKPMSEPSIVFTESDRDGNVKEQVLVPRSQRLAQSGVTPIETAAKSISPSEQSEPGQSVGDSVAEPLNKSHQPVKSPQPISSPQPEVTSLIQTSQTEKTARPEITSVVSEPPSPVETQDNVTAQEGGISASPQPVELEELSAKTEPTAKEAPSLDLSLFLPKIKTLSEEEIAQQIEALTQTAVSQAQLESELAQAAQIAQISKQAETESEELIRNTSNAPDWAVPSFQVLLFSVAGLKLAVPLHELNGIVQWGDEYITEMPGHASWYLGLIQNQGQNVPVIDTLQQVVPKNRWPANHLNERNFKHIILIDNGHWGLACEQVHEVITLRTDSVKWRSSRTKRRWLLGTVIEHMCALLDSAAFAAMLETGDDSLINE